MSPEGCAAHPVVCNSLLQIVLAVWRIILNWNWNLLGGLREPSAGYMAVWYASKKAPNNHHYLQRAATPDQITQQNSLQRAGGPYRQ